MIRVEIATLDALKYVAEHMREADRVELSATSLSDSATYLADNIMAHAVAAFVARDENRLPISAWGLYPMWPGVGTVFAFGTDDWGKALLTMTRQVRRFMIPFVLDHGFHRVECRALAGRKDVARWLALLGAKQEAVLRSSGRRGEDFILYRWLSDEHRQAATAARAPSH